MEITRVEKENRDFFVSLCPGEILDDDDLLKLGVIDDENIPLSVCALGIKDDMASLEWLYTDPGSREKGAASLLLEKIGELTDGLNLRGIEAGYVSGDGDLDTFLSDRDFLVCEDAGTYTVPVSDLVFSRIMDRISENKGDESIIKRLSEVEASDKVLKIAARTYNLDPKILKDASPEFSVVSADHDGNLKGGIFISEESDEDLTVLYFVNDGSLESLFRMLDTLGEALVELKRTDSRLRFTDRSENAAALVERITENDIEDYMTGGVMYAVKIYE